MKTQYEAKGLDKMTEQYVYNEGCLPNSGISCDIDVSFKADSVEGIVKQIGEFLGLNEAETKDACELDACDQVGRIDFQTLENNEGYKASKREVEGWKKGEVKLWAGYYIAYVEKVTRETVALTK